MFQCVTDKQDWNSLMSKTDEFSPAILGSVFTGFDAFVTQKGLNIDSMLERAGIDADMLSNTEKQVSLNAFSELLEICAKEVRDPCFGLHYGEFYKPGSSGAFGYVLMNSPTVLDAARNIVRYMNIFVSIRTISLDYSGGNARLCWTYPINFHPRTQFADLAMTIVLQRLRLGAGQNWHPITVDLEHRTPKDITPYRRIMGELVNFAAPENSITIDHETLSLPMQKADHQLYDVIESFCNRLMQERSHEGDILKIIRRAIVDGLAHGQTTLEGIAQHTDLKPNEIRRELEQMGTTFQYIMSDTRFALADRYLRDTDLPLTEVALLLGFSELSAFSRACNRWFNMPPSTYRKTQR